MTEPRVEETQTFDFTGINDDASLKVTDKGETFTLAWGEFVGLVREYFGSGRAFDENNVFGSGPVGHSIQDQGELLPIHPAVLYQDATDNYVRELELYAEHTERVNAALRRAITAKSRYNSLNAEFDKYMAGGI